MVDRALRFNLLGRDVTLGRTLDQTHQKTSRLGSGLAKVGLIAGTSLVAGAAAAAAGAYKLGASFDDAYDTIRVGTGKTGKALGGLQQDFKAVVKDVPTDFASAATAISTLNLRTGQTGKGLQQLAKQVLELSRLTKTDLGANIAASTRLFRDWSIPTKRQAATLDEMFRASQQTGVGVTDLMEKVVQFGSPLRQLGFSLDQTTALFGEFERAGVVTETVLPGLKMALKSYALAHKDPQKALIETIKRIKESSTTAQANTIAFKTFGARAGPDLAAAIREGHFDLDALIKTISGGHDTIMRASADTQDFAEKWTKFRNRIAVLIQPAVSGLFTAIGTGADKLGPALGKIGDFAGKIRTAISGAIDTSGAATIAKSWWTALSSGLVAAVKGGDWSAFGRQLADAAQRIIGTGTALFQRAFDKVDWKGLGSFFGSKLGSVIGGIQNIGAAIGQLFTKINWFKLGEDAALAAVPFIFGFTSNLINGIVNAFRENFWGSLLAVLSVIPIGRVAAIFKELPLLGPIAKAISKAGEALEKPIFALIRFIGRKFFEGFEQVFPEVAGKLKGMLLLLDTAIRSKAIDIFRAAKRYVEGFLQGIGSEAGLIIKNIGEFIGWITRPFRAAGGWLIRRGAEVVIGLVRGIGSRLGATGQAAGAVISRLTSPFRAAGGWLIRRGIEAISGLGRGIVSMLGSVGTWMARTRGAITRPFAKAGSWLFNTGRSILSGIAAGIRAALKGIGTVLSEVKNAIIGGLKRLFGIKSPSTVMAGLGGHIIRGLIKGLLTTSGALSRVVKSIGGNVLGLLGALFSGIGKPGGPVYASIQDLGQAMVTARWGPSQWPAFNALEMGEAGWNPFARNPSSGAYGIPQALPPSKLPPAAFSADAMTAAAAQLQWMIGYISERYGTPANAYATWLSRVPHWYAGGLSPTVFSQPTLIGVGEAGPETVSVLPGRGRGLDEDRLARKIAAALVEALRTSPPRVAVDDIHQGLLRKKNARTGGMSLGLS